MTAPTLTRNQQLVLDSLERAHTPKSAYAILDDLREDGFRAPLQVYRALDKLIDRGLVHRIESLNAFVACCAGHDHGRSESTVIFMLCRECGSVDEFVDEDVAARLEALCRDRNFKAEKRTVEMRGLCAPCAASA